MGLRRPRLDSGNDGHRSRPRPQRRHSRSARGDVGRLARFAYDSYRRFITMYSDVVLGFEHSHFEDILDTFKDSQGYTLDTDLTGEDWVDSGRPLQGCGGARNRQGLPAGSARSVVGRNWCGVFVVDECARGDLPPAARIPEHGAPRSTFRRWCSAIWARPRRPGLPSLAIRRPARAGCMAIPDQAQGEDVVRAFAPRRTLPNTRARNPSRQALPWKPRCPRHSRN